MSDYPSSIKTFTNPSASSTQDTAGVYHDVQHSDANNEINAIETELGVDPKTITDNVSPAASPSSVANFLDMVATQLKAIAGTGNWYSAISTSLNTVASSVATLTSHLTDYADPHQVTATQVGLGNVDNTSNATERAASATLENKTLTSPVINTQVTGTAIATGAEVTTGTDDTQIVTPKAIGDAGVNTRLKSKLITATRVGNANDGDVSYTGVGFMPTALHTLAQIDGISYCCTTYTDSAKASSGFYRETDTNFYSTTNTVLITPGGTGYMGAVVKSYDADGFTLTWSKALSPSSATIKITFFCFR